MTFTPYISIYKEGNFNYAWFGDNLTRAILIFSKNIGYCKQLSRKRVNIHLGYEERAHTNGSIKSVWIKNTVDTSLDISDANKIKTALKIIYDALMTVAEIEKWDTTVFEKAYRLSIADDGHFVWHSQTKTNKSRTLKARVKISLDKDGKVPVIAEFFDSKLKPQFEIPVINTFLHFVDWERLFGKPAWLSNERFGFSFCNAQLLIFANSVSGQSETVIVEKAWSRQEIEGELRRLTFRQFENHKEFAEWMNK
jgi:hypothetical protein